RSSDLNNELTYDTSYVNEVDIGGIEETKKSLIEPRSIIFHNNGRYFSYTDPLNSQNLYKDMQSWVLYDLTVSDASIPSNKYMVELIFPDAIPVKMLPSLFTLNKDEPLPNWSFKRIFITFDPSATTLHVTFLSVDERKQATAMIDNTGKYDLLWSALSQFDDLSEYVLFEPGDEKIYLLKNDVQMKKRSMAVKGTDPDMLVNALFSNPSLVSANVGEAYFTDGQRGLSVMHDEKNMEFINPINPNFDPMDPADLLDSSISNVNEHKGWTNTYKLEKIDRSANSLRFRMRYDGYPVYNRNDLSVIEQVWREQELHQYRRPLFILNNSLGEDPVTLPSGSDVIFFLQNESEYEIDKISDIQVGYQLSYLDNATYSLMLEPAWYVNYKGHWQEIKMNDDRDKGGN